MAQGQKKGALFDNQTLYSRNGRQSYLAQYNGFNFPRDKYSESNQVFLSAFRQFIL